MTNEDVLAVCRDKQKNCGAFCGVFYKNKESKVVLVSIYTKGTSSEIFRRIERISQSSDFFSWIDFDSLKKTFGGMAER